MCGISSGASVRSPWRGMRSFLCDHSCTLTSAQVWAAKQLAARPENKGKTIVCIIPSFGERYLSTVLYANLWEEASAQKAEPLE